MASLWNKNKKLKTISQKPSFVNYDKNKDPAQDPQRFFRRKPSLPASLFKKVQAGMTVEAAIVLPVCLLFLMNLGYAVEMIRLHNNLQFALWDVGGRTAVYGCELGEDRIPTLITDFYIGTAWAKNIWTARRWLEDAADLDFGRADCRKQATSWTLR